MTIRAMSTAATGMGAMQEKIDIIANNLSNVNTTGYKKSRINFQDLLYQHMKEAGFLSNAGGNQTPTGIQIGLGVKVASTQKIFTQGELTQTENPFDTAILGDGFFRVIMPDGTYGYTRDGSFRRDGEGNLVTASGLLLDPEINIPAEVTKINISVDGIVEGLISADQAPVQLGEIELTRFPNPSGLKAVGDNLLLQTSAAGTPIVGQPGEQGTGLGMLQQFFLEESNVDVVKELVDMINTQRAFEMNSKSIQTADDMLSTVTNLRR